MAPEDTAPERASKTPLSFGVLQTRREAAGGNRPGEAVGGRTLRPPLSRSQTTKDQRKRDDDTSRNKKEKKQETGRAAVMAAQPVGTAGPTGYLMHPVANAVMMFDVANLVRSERAQRSSHNGHEDGQRSDRLECFHVVGPEMSDCRMKCECIAGKSTLTYSVERFIT